MKKLEVGMRVGKTVFAEDGRVLLQKDVALTDVYLLKLLDKGIPCIFINDEMSEEIEIDETIEPALKIKAMQTVKSIMKEMTPLASNTNRKNKMFISKRTLLDIKDIVAEMMDNLKNSEGALVRIVEMMGTDMYTYNHSVNVAILAMMIGLEVLEGITKEEKDEKVMALGYGALLHDVGKSMVDPRILNKAGKLTDAEFAEVKKHVKYGYDMINDNPQISAMKYGGIIKGCILLHHENLDGSGYPNGWTSDKINEYARIMRIADLYSAMTSDKVYKKKMPPYEALEQISAMCYKTIDPVMFKALKERLAIYPEGTGVMMNTGEKGIVTMNDERRSDRPIVKIIKDTEGKHHKGFKVVDMMEEMTYFIVDTVDI